MKTITTPYEDTISGLNESLANLGNFGLEATVTKSFEGVGDIFENMSRTLGNCIAPMESNLQ